MFEICDYHPMDSTELFDALRGSDIRYIARLTKGDPQLALERSFDDSDKTYTIHEGGAPVALLAYKGDNVWLQTSRMTDGRAKEVIRCGREAISLLPDKPMHCVVPKDDKRVMLLCKALGFAEEGDSFPNYCDSGLDHVALWRIP